MEKEEGAAALRDLAVEAEADRAREAELKGSIGEGPNHSNHSNRSNSFKIGIFTRKFKNFRKFQHFLNYRRISGKISSKSEQKSVKRIKKTNLKFFAIFCQKMRNFLTNIF